MGIKNCVTQLRPRQNKSVDHLKQINSLLEAESVQIPIDELLPTSATERTQIYEAAVVLVAMGGSNLTASKIKSVMKSKPLEYY